MALDAPATPSLQLLAARGEFVPLVSLPAVGFPWWSSPKSLRGRAQQLIPFPKCCCSLGLPKTFHVGALTAQVVNFSEFQFQSGTTPRAPGQGTQCHQQLVVEQGCSQCSMVLEHPSHAQPGSSLLPTSPGATRSWTLTPSPGGTCRVPHKGHSCPCAHLRPSALPAMTTFASQTNLHFEVTHLRGA